MRLLTVFMSILLFALGCGEHKDEMLRLGTNVWAGYEPLYAAREKGYLDRDRVRLVEYSSTSQVMQAYRNGLIDAAGVTLDEAMLLLDTGEDPLIVIVADISNGADAIIGQRHIKSLNDLEGKRIGLELTALGAYMLSRATEIAGIKATSIDIVHKDADEHEQAFRNSDIDAVITFEPIRSRLLNAGGVQLFDSRQIPGEIVDIFVVRRQFAKDNPSTISHLKNAWFQMLSEIENDLAGNAKLLGTRMKLDAQQTVAAFEGLKLPNQSENDELLNPSSSHSLVTTSERLARLMAERKLIRNRVNAKKLFENHH